MLNRFALIMVLFLAACRPAPRASDSGTSASPPSPDKPPTGGMVESSGLLLHFLPSDLMTSVDGSPIGVGLTNGGKPISEQLVESLVDSLRLVDVEGTVVETAVALQVDPPFTSPEDGPEKRDSPAGNGAIDGNVFHRAYVYLSPLTALSPKWHAIELTSVPDGVDVVDWRAPEVPGARFRARFHPASKPTITYLELCPKTDDNWRATLVVSERLSIPSDRADLLSLQVSGAFCVVVTEDEENSQSTLSFDCNAIDPSGSWVFEMRPGLVGFAGEPLSVFSGETSLVAQFTLDELGPHPDGACKMLRF
jgi:hypothetical protein